MKPKRELQRKKTAKKVSQLLMKEAKNNTEDLKNDKNDVSDDANLENSNKTVFSICNCYGKIAQKRKLVNM